MRSIEEERAQRAQRAEWLAGLGEGSRVAIENWRVGWAKSAPRAAEVVRTTKTQLIVNGRGYEERFRKEDGMEVGGCDRIVPYTEAIAREIVEANARVRFSRLAAKEGKDLSARHIAAMLEAYDRVQAELVQGGAEC